MIHEIRLTLAFLTLGLVWIGVSDLLLIPVRGGQMYLTVNLLLNGLFVGFVGVIFFVLLRLERRHRRSAEAQRCQNETSYRLLFTSHPIPMWVYDLETLQFLDVNNAAISTYQYTLEQFLAMTIKDIRPPEDVKRLLERLADGRLSYQHSGQWRHKRADGELFNVDIVSHEISYRGRRAVLVTAMDITEKQRTQNALYESEQRLNSILNSIEDIVWSISFDTWEILYINPAIERISGVSADVMRRTRSIWTNILDREDYAALAASMQEVRRHGTSSVEFRLRDVNGDLHQMYQRSWIVSDAQGLPQRIDSIVTDITERKALQQEILEKETLRQELSQEIELRAMRNRFISMVSHEFRTPLTAIGTSTELLVRYYDRIEGPQREKHFSRIFQYVRQLTSLLDDMLNVLRSETVGPEFHFSDVEVVALCEEICEELSHYDNNPHRVIFSHDMPELTARLDERLLRQALGNLIINAIKYSPDADAVYVQLDQSGDQLDIEVRDEGIGIPESALPELFNVFYRATNTGSIPGTGLGLTIARQAVELHHGQISIESKLLEGTCVRMRLPLQPVS